MSIKKLIDGRYEVDVRPQGSEGKRIRRKFDRKAEAQTFERYILANFHNKEWVDKPADKRLLSELIELWWKYLGQNTKHGEQERLRLYKIDREMSNPRIYMITRKFLMEYRAQRLSFGLSPATVNRDLSVLSGMFSTLIEAEEFHSENPICAISKLRLKNSEMSFLSEDEIADLLAKATGDQRRIALLCLSTGARWGEAKNLRGEHIVGNKVTFVETKNGKKRSIPISDEMLNIIKTKKSGQLFNSDYNEFRSLLKELKPDLPKGQASHALRHTFATHFMMNGGNIITLQRILGHSNIQQTMNYAHFAPDFLQDAITLNPLRGVCLVHNSSIG